MTNFLYFYFYSCLMNKMLYLGRVVTLYVFRGNHVWKMSSKYVRTDIRVGHSPANGLILQWFCVQRTAWQSVWWMAGWLPPRSLGGAAVRIPTVGRSNQPKVGVADCHAVHQCRPPDGVANSRPSSGHPRGPRMSDASASASDRCSDPGQPCIWGNSCVFFFTFLKV
jgi:hypothetical protein